MIGIDGVDHFGLVVADLESVSAFLEQVLGLRSVRRLESATSKMAFFDCGGATIEAYEPKDAALRAERLGDASARVDHVAFRVGDLGDAVAALAAYGVETTTPQAATGRLSCFTVPATSGGVMYQLIEGAAD